MLRWGYLPKEDLKIRFPNLDFSRHSARYALVELKDIRDDALIGLAKRENAIGTLLPAMEKFQLFRGVIANGALPGKTFSVEHARKKRYYIEARKIK